MLSAINGSTHVSENLINPADTMPSVMVWAIVKQSDCRNSKRMFLEKKNIPVMNSI
jgi:hypothetical protein